MKVIGFRNRSALCGLVLFIGLNGAFKNASAQKSTSEGNGTSALDTAEVLKQIDKLMEQNRQLENTNRELIDQIEMLRQALAKKIHAASASAPQEANSGVDQPTREVVVNTPQRQVTQESQGSEADSEAPEAAEPERWGTYTPNRGFRLANTEHGDLNLSIYTYVRYLNQLGLDSTYTDAFGNVKNIQRRQDFQIQKSADQISGMAV